MVTEGFESDLGPAGRAELSGSPPGGLLDVLGVAAIVLDAEGRIVFWSPQAQALIGYSAEEALGRLAIQLMVADEQIGRASCRERVL